MANQGDRYRRRNRFSRRGEGRARRWAAVMAVALIVALLWLFPLPNSQNDAVEQSLSDVDWQTVEENPEGGTVVLADGSYAGEGTSALALEPGSIEAGTVVINSSLKGVNTYDESDPSVLSSSNEVRAGVDAIGASDAIAGNSSFSDKKTLVSTGEPDVIVPNKVGVGDSEDTSGIESREVSLSTDDFDFGRWGYESYEAYVADHPFWARFNYARLWTGRALEMAQPAGCSACARQERKPKEAVVERHPVVVERPVTGQIFLVESQGRLPQLTVVAPHGADAFVKLKDADSGETVLSFYVRSGTTVEACVPARACEFYYAMGSDWLGPEEAFGEDGVYAKSDRALDFSNPSREYTYTFGSDGGNVEPVTIPRSEFI
ncbi:hypothetical protein VJ918_05225 [Adlercreutzia sp. R21]|uniref:hypothetical protein n=1 Tax=Adlercreutzia wanghongyangiae TaxID=3111451 RepID=UPI002DBEE6BF|nr:hypothetical protein [Adlercreutzia sp. R21]MEC4184208.1 hypothetical protein [Adlercreutzia sp. R21]